MINKDINIKVLSNSMIILDKTILGINGENLQGKIIFNFEEFVDGVAWLEIEKENGEKGYIQMTKENETYTLEIKSSLLSQAGYIYMQLRITQDENVNGIAVFKSKKFYVEVLNAINATDTIEDDYPSIIDIVNTKQDKLTAGENITIKDNVISANIEGTVNKTYVDDQDTKTLESAKQYADKQVPNVVETYVNEHKDELKGDKGDKGEQGKQGIQGEKGANGKDGINGQDGVSPLATITQTSSGATISIVDKNGTTSAEIKNGVDGKNGTNGKDGENGVAGQDGKNYSVEVVESTTTTQEIQPNKFYKFGEVSSLNITLAAITDTSVLNEYMFEFTSGSTATTLTLPNTIKWLETPTIESNKIYQCSIVDNVGVLLGVSNV